MRIEVGMFQGSVRGSSGAECVGDGDRGFATGMHRVTGGVAKEGLREHGLGLGSLRLCCETAAACCSDHFQP